MLIEMPINGLGWGSPFCIHRKISSCGAQQQQHNETEIKLSFHFFPGSIIDCPNSLEQMNNGAKQITDVQLALPVTEDWAGQE